VRAKNHAHTQTLLVIDDVRLAGMGKSARAMRLKDVLCKGWIVNGANESSAKAGMNGNMDDKCGRCVYAHDP